MQPYEGGYAVACGLGAALEYIAGLRFEPSDLEYLETLRGQDGQRLFDPAFLDYLGRMRFSCDVDAVPDGTVVFPHEPLARITGPLLQAQLLETPLVNLFNFQTLIATKAARVCQSAGADQVIEFGMRRAHGLDGGVSASWAAYVGGCAATSNLLAGKLYGIPVRGTHAHSWVMAFDSELEAFQRYAESMPNHCVFLVDTYNTLAGVTNAVQVGRWLRERGHRLYGIRLDSGDLAYLSVEARKILDAAGFKDTVILASNDLDEHTISSLKQQGAAITVWGVGTRLASAHGQANMGTVYKLTALRDAAGVWQPRVKVSEQSAKSSVPGVLQVRRFERGDEFVADVIYDTEIGLPSPLTVVDPIDPLRRKKIPTSAKGTDLLVPIFRGGKSVYASPAPPEIQRYAREQVNKLHGGIRRLVNPHLYPAGLEQNLHERRMRLILEEREKADRARRGVRP
jgi:nicotinate phosphoribosyltransferase